MGWRVGPPGGRGEGVVVGHASRARTMGGIEDEGCILSEVSFLEEVIA